MSYNLDSWNNKIADLSDLLGQTIKEIESSPNYIIFHCDDGKSYALHHVQDCCESVTVDDIVGNLDDLIGSPILKAEESNSYPSEEEIKEEYNESYTWTFYKFATIKGYVDIKWYGTSNGYYSESVDFCLLNTIDDCLLKSIDEDK